MKDAARAYALLESVPSPIVWGDYYPLRRTHMIGDLFDSPWKILIVALVIIVLFGSKKLPSAARSLGQSMRILQKEVQGLHEDEPQSRPRALRQRPRHLPRSPPAPRAGSEPGRRRSTRGSSRSVTCSQGKAMELHHPRCCP